MDTTCWSYFNITLFHSCWEDWRLGSAYSESVGNATHISCCWAYNIAYAQSAHLYLQEMQWLEELMPPDDFRKYSAQWYFTFSQSNKFWSGVWSDMTIEQVLMKTKKPQGGLRQGWGITDTTLIYLICALPMYPYYGGSVWLLISIIWATYRTHKSQGAPTCNAE